MRNILFFEKMLTPKIIILLYWSLLLVAIMGGVFLMFSGPYGFTIVKFFTGILLALGGAVGARVWCELLIVLFKINDSLQDIKNK